MSFAALAGVILICTVWGAGFSCIKVTLRYLPPLLLVGFRFLITAFLIGIYLRLTRIEWRVPRRMLGWILLLTLMFYLQQGFILVGLTLTRAGRMSVLLNTQPIITAVAAHWFVAHDRLTWAKMVGLVLALLGVLLVFRESFAEMNQGVLRGDLLAVSAAVLWGAQIIMTKHVAPHISPTALIFWLSALSSLLFLASSAGFEHGPIPARPLDLPFLGAAAFVVLASTVIGFVGWVYLIKHNSPSQVSSFCFITPIAGVLIAWLLLDEPLTGDVALATVLVGAGIFAANYRGLNPTPAATPESCCDPGEETRRHGPHESE